MGLDTSRNFVEEKGKEWRASGRTRGRRENYSLDTMPRKRWNTLAHV